MEGIDHDGLSGQTDAFGDAPGRVDMTPTSKTKARSLSDGGPPQLSPSPHIVEATRRTSKDDSELNTDHPSNPDSAAPVTPRRTLDFPMRAGSGLHLSLQMPARGRDSASPVRQFPQNQQQHQQQHMPLKPTSTPTPLSPKLDHSQIYASPTNILPRRSRGLDFSRAATSLHHSTLAEQSSPDSSPTIGGRAMNIPGRGGFEYGAEQSSNSLWSLMGTQERMNISSSVGSTNVLESSSSSSEDDDFLDDEMEDAIMSTPQAGTRVNQATIPCGGGSNVVPWMPDSSPAPSGLSSFRSRSRPRKQPRRKFRNLIGGGFNAASPAALSRSPPNSIARDIKENNNSHSRRESISWAANQLHISANNSEERSTMDGSEDTTPTRDGQRGVVKRVVTRRGNLFPKTKGFARIRQYLAEETMPVDSEVRREAEVIRQVRESDMDLEPRIPQGAMAHPEAGNTTTAHSSPNLNPTREALEDPPEDDMITEAGNSGSFKHQVLKNSKGKNFWEAFTDAGSANGPRVTPPPPAAFLPRGSSSGISEDVNMDSPSLSTGSGNTSLFGQASGTVVPGGSESQRSDSQQPSQGQIGAGNTGSSSIPPTAAEITKRIHSKRRRDDDFDPVSFKRRAVSPGMSVHNSPIMQSPMQRDVAPWGSRPGSNHGGEGGKPSGTPSENGSTGNSGSTSAAGNATRPINGAKGRVGFQGMTDTHDGLMRMSIE